MMSPTLAINQSGRSSIAENASQALGETATAQQFSAAHNDQIFGPGLGVLRQYMQLLTNLANQQHTNMKFEGDLGIEAQKVVADLDTLIGVINGNKDSNNNTTENVEADSDIAKLMKNHPEILEGKGFSLPGKLNRKQLMEIKSLTQKYATQHSDASSRSQSQIQKTMQTYNVTVSLMNSLQTMLGDMTKQFSQAIR